MLALWLFDAEAACAEYCDKESAPQQWKIFP
jgi:hypothetical protein